ncbi:hypothetical protein [Larkinella harenae]
MKKSQADEALKIAISPEKIPTGGPVYVSAAFVRQQETFRPLADIVGFVHVINDLKENELRFLVRHLPYAFIGL